MQFNQNYGYSQPPIIQQQPIDNMRQIYAEQTLPYPRSNIGPQYPPMNNNLYLPHNYNQNYPQQFQYQDTGQTLIIPT
jgi:hypothetical protein